MPFATSCFNPTLYRKTMLRFWPLWAVYGLMWLFILPLYILTNYFDYLRYSPDPPQQQLFEMATELPQMLPFALGAALVVSILAAMAVYGYLYNNRSAGAMHALPLRREALFFTQYLAGLSFLVLPQLVVGGCTAALELVLLPPAMWSGALGGLGTFMLGQLLLCIFFFSFATFCAMFTGHVLALPAFYGILNGLAYVMSSLLALLMSQYYYGFARSGPLAPDFVELLTPVIPLMNACYMYYYGSEQLMIDWPVLGLYAGVGVVLTLLALLVYRYRHIETAGDVVSVPLVRPVFLVGVTVCSGLCLGYLTSMFFGLSTSPLMMSVYVLVWSVVGWCVAQMLLKKSFRVFHTWKGGLVATVCMGVLCLVLTMDPLGVELWVPHPTNVEKIDIHGNFTVPYDSGSNSIANITDPDQIAMITQLHQAIVYQGDPATQSSYLMEGADGYIYLSMRYTLSQGRVVERRYYSVPIYQNEVDQQGTISQLATAIANNRDLVQMAYNFDHFETGRLIEAYVTGIADENGDRMEDYYFNGNHQQLWQAVRADFEAGTIGVRYLFDDQERMDNTYRTDLAFSFEFQDESYQAGKPQATYVNNISITLTPNASNTLALLKQQGLNEEFFLLPHEAPMADEFGSIYPTDTPIVYER